MLPVFWPLLEQTPSVLDFLCENRKFRLPGTVCWAQRTYGDPRKIHVQQGSEALTLQEALGILRRRMPLIAACLLVVAVAAYGFSKHQTKKYTATAVLAFDANPITGQIAGLSLEESALSPAAQQVHNLELVRLGDTAVKTASLLGHGLTAEQVAASVQVSAQSESGVIDVSSTATSPAMAASIANTYTNQFVKEQQSTRRQYFKSTLAVVDKQLSALSPAQRAGQAGLALENKAQTLSLLAELHYGNVQVAQDALVPTSPSSPKPAKSALIGALLGLLLGLGLVYALEHVDRRIRGPRDLDEIYGARFLGAVQVGARPWRSLRKEPTEAETFGLIHARLRLFKAERELRTLMVASATSGEGKTTVAHLLADAAVRSGSRVLLVEANLRHPTLARQLAIPPEPGLADVLRSGLPLGEATQSVNLMPVGQANEKGVLDVLSAGKHLDRDPVEMLALPQMAAMIERAREIYDLVVIDPAPLAAAPDGLPLLRAVDGVLVLASVGRTRRDAAERLQQIIVSSETPLVGVIANCLRSRDRGRRATPNPPTATGVAVPSAMPSAQEPISSNAAESPRASTAV